MQQLLSDIAGFVLSEVLSDASSLLGGEVAIP